mmetsp:Transcript_9042/g.24533  ORF Transcript_9042/g.24533 Transcript_9042/m.24533 type:complete len:232 (-) Transcript_9042:49-744(-)
MLQQLEGAEGDRPVGENAQQRGAEATVEGPEALCPHDLLHRGQVVPVARSRAQVGDHSRSQDVQGVRHQGCSCGGHGARDGSYGARVQAIVARGDCPKPSADSVIGQELHARKGHDAPERGGVAAPEALAAQGLRHGSSQAQRAAQVVGCQRAHLVDEPHAVQRRDHRLCPRASHGARDEQLDGAERHAPVAPQQRQLNRADGSACGCTRARGGGHGYRPQGGPVRGRRWA